jgi:type IV secretory pathway TrbD component
MIKGLATIAGFGVLVFVVAIGIFEVLHRTAPNLDEMWE